MSDVPSAKAVRDARCRARSVFAVAGAVTLGISVVACSSSGSDTQGGSRGVDAKSHTITIGMTGPQTGPLAAAYESTYGAIARLASANNTVNGWKIKYIQLDDQYQPAQALANAQKLVQQNKVFAIVAQGGSPTTAAVLPYAVQAKVLDVAPVTESGVVLTKYASATNVFAFEPPYAQLAAYDLNYVHKNLPGKYAVAYQSGSAGAAALAGWQYQGKVLGTSAAATVGAPPSATDFSGYAARLKDSGAATVLTWLAPNQLAALIQASTAVGFKPQWVADWPDLSSAFLKLAGPAGTGMLFGNWAPPTVNPSAEIAKVVNSIKAATSDKEPSVAAVLGWVGMSVFIEGLTRATSGGKVPTAASFTSALRDCAPFDAGGIGIKVSYCGDKLTPQRDSMYKWDGDSLTVVSGPEDMPSVPTENLAGKG